MYVDIIIKINTKRGMAKMKAELLKKIENGTIVAGVVGLGCHLLSKRQKQDLKR